MEVVPKPVAAGWKQFSSEGKPKLEAELKAAREEVARLKPEANAAAVLRKQLETEGRTVADPKDLVPVLKDSLKSEFVSAADRKAIVDEAVKAATQQVNFGSLPMAVGIVSDVERARREYGLDISPENYAEAVTRFGGREKAYSALTHDAAAAKAAADQKARDDAHAAEVAKAREEGIRLGRQEADTRAYNPEEGGMSGVIPMVPPQDTANKVAVNPQTYNPSDGVLAREAASQLAKQEADGLWGTRTVQ
jgi:hypothetical protein